MIIKLTMALLLLGVSVAAQTRKSTRIMAVTFDDLPYVPAGPDNLQDARHATDEILRVLRDRRVPVVAFINEAKLHVPKETQERTGLLRKWVEAGATLGNHTYSHQDLNTLTTEEFQEEIIKGDVVTRQLMQKRGPYQLYFRHPFTHTGDTQEKKESIERFLAERGYKVAPHTIDGQDYFFNTCNVRALREKDQALAKRLREAYVDFTLAATEFAERISVSIFGREIPQTLLVHANDITADSLAELLTRLAARGYRFISLDEAMGDTAYQTKDIYVTKAGPSWLWRWMKSKGMAVSFKEDPEPPQWVVDLCRQK